MCPHAPQKLLTSNNGPSVNVEAITSDVVPKRPPIIVSAQSPTPPTKPLRGLPYRAPSTWGPRRGAPVQAPKVEAEAVIREGGLLHPGKFKMVKDRQESYPLSTTPPLLRPEPRFRSPQGSPLSFTKAKAIKTPGAPRKNGKMATNLQAIEDIVRLEYCVVDVPSKPHSNRRVMRATPIETVVAAEYVVVNFDGDRDCP
ncbi:hypothetical protein BS47DRAFT_1359951 [Hydnum rufescens UP504]|uniref:Uncharacterized protein n=1 Tax=Hydnum rufescens UP504 TaxID=1448309 RepID=A0A9P6B3C6_9AGAM|nr:hypothetical protein BS47DRAFT_1359951 [Hydnum rufescens UP504]